MAEFHCGRWLLWVRKDWRAENDDRIDRVHIYGLNNGAHRTRQIKLARWTVHIGIACEPDQLTDTSSVYIQLCLGRRIGAFVWYCECAERSRGQAVKDGGLLAGINSLGQKLNHADHLSFLRRKIAIGRNGMMFWLLAKHPEWQTALREECEALFKHTGREALQYEDLDRLPKTDWVFKEALRLYSPLQILPRRPVRSFPFEGHRIPANATVYLLPQAVHFDPAHFPDPDRFNPARFCEGEADKRNTSPYAFIPFGRGSHMCLGMHFAHMEIKAVIYQTLRHRTLALEDSASPELEYLPIVRPNGELEVRFTPRV